MAPDLLSTIRAEIAERLDGLRPLLAEHERLLVAAEALEAAHGEGSPTDAAASGAARGVAREAILAALEHGSHTVGELGVVTAMTGPNINGNLRRLAAEGVVVKTEREGKGAWALAEPAF